MNTNKKGFTLLELLVVIAIIAILATAVVLILNPAALFAQARDSQRISDMGTLRTAISLYLSTVTSADLGSDTGGAFTCGTNWGSSFAAPGVKRVSASSGSPTKAGNTGIDGSGWVPVDFNAIPGGSPLSVLPTDPRNDATYNYQYSCSAPFTFEVNADMESGRYGNTGSDDVESTDGGNNIDVYEVGNDPGLDI